jgi:gamma-glutamyltranspeptidase/glutathione hydrolase
MVVSNHPLASLAGAEMLIKGGNAIDASVATLCALTVVEPMMVSVFGAGFFNIRLGETGDVFTIDNYAVAPKAATEDMYDPVERLDPSQSMFETVDRRNTVGYLSVAVPGAMKAWEHVVQRFGSLTLKEVMQPAIRYAREGFKASSYLVRCINDSMEDLAQFPASAEVFLPHGKPPKPNQLILREDYAKTLEKIARKGSDVLYKGEVARTVIDDIQENGGIMTKEDLKRYSITYREPVRGTYREQYEIISTAPVSSGGIHIIQMLNILEHFDLSSLGFGSPQHIHLFTEALKIAFADRQKYMGDPGRVSMPIQGLVDKRYAAERVKEINLSKAQAYTPGEPTLYENNSDNTTHVSAIDEKGNVVTTTQTLNSLFGSKVTVPGTGMFLNNCMALFNPHPGFANSVAGGSRMLSSMAPTIVLKKDKPYMCLGTPGGTRIFASVCQAIVNVIDYGMTIQESVEAPRFWTTGIPGTGGEKLNLEAGFSDDLLEGLRKMGHEILIVPRVAGGMNGIMVDQKTEMLHGAACWRADGVPIGLSGGPAHPNVMKKGN